MPPSVLLVARHYFPYIGGIETAVRQYARWYAETGHAVTVLCCANDGDWRTSVETLDGIRVIRAASPFSLLSLPLSPAFMILFLRLAGKFDRIHINLQFPLASLAAFIGKNRIRGRFIVSYHCDVYRQKHLKHLTYFFDRKAVQRADTVITGSQALRERSDVLSRVRRPVEVLPYAIDQAMGPEEPPSGNPGAFFLFFGRLVAYKGTRVLDAAFRRLMAEDAPIRLVVFGMGPESYRFRALAKEFPDRLVFIERALSQEEKNRLLGQARAFVFPSEFPSEAFGIAQLDAMAAGTPIINTWLHTGVNWVAPDGVCAITLKAGDVDMLAQTLKACEAGRYDLKKLGASGHKRARALFSEEAVQKKFREIIGKNP